jgi:hypothetical protein
VHTLRVSACSLQMIPCNDSVHRMPCCLVHGVPNLQVGDCQLAILEACLHMMAFMFVELGITPSWEFTQPGTLVLRQ